MPRGVGVRVSPPVQIKEASIYIEAFFVGLCVVLTMGRREVYIETFILNGVGRILNGVGRSSIENDESRETLI